MQRYHPANCTSAVNNSATGGGSSGRSDSSSIGNYSLNSRHVLVFSLNYSLLCWYTLNNFFLFYCRRPPPLTPYKLKCEKDGLNSRYFLFHILDFPIIFDPLFEFLWFHYFISTRLKSFEPLATLFHLSFTFLHDLYFSKKKLQTWTAWFSSSNSNFSRREPNQRVCSVWIQGNCWWT